MERAVVRESTIRAHYEAVRRAITAMRDQIDQPLSLQSLARIGVASPYHFTRTFRRVTGLPPFQFLSALRLDAARQLLLHTRRKVIEICYDVGYSSLGTFTRTFTHAFGVSPRTFRTLAERDSRAITGPVGLTLRDRSRTTGPTLSGRITTAQGFNGIICVGIFPTPIPQSKPMACCIAAEDGSYRIHDVPQGRWFLFALGLPYPLAASDCVAPESALRGGGHALSIAGEDICGETDLVLRPALETDPPILLLLPNGIRKRKNKRNGSRAYA
ncbi:MAG TPA: AraC family transcriptional regulator [Candidatus Limnocylindrales bacterium]|nr:AraC family transcriptional regulator [Candidatus Limnocylindrales bacterium]